MKQLKLQSIKHLSGKYSILSVMTLLIRLYLLSAKLSNSTWLICPETTSASKLHRSVGRGEPKVSSIIKMLSLWAEWEHVGGAVRGNTNVHVHKAAQHRRNPVVWKLSWLMRQVSSFHSSEWTPLWSPESSSYNTSIRNTTSWVHCCCAIPSGAATVEK